MGYLKLVKKMKQSDLLVTPRLQEWLFHNSHLLLDEERAEMLKQLVMTKPRNRAASFSSSSRGDCLRRQVFGYIGVPQRGEVDPELHHIFIDGTWRHIRWQMMLLTAGIVERIEYPFHRPELRLRGSLDGANLTETWGFELKGTSDWKVTLQGQSIPKHYLQIHTYFIGAPELDRFVLLYEDKKFQHWREEIVYPDPKLMKIVKDELAYLNWCVDNKELPEILEECKGGKGKTFRECPYKNTCLGCDSYEEAEAEAQPVVLRKRRVIKRR